MNDVVLLNISIDSSAEKIWQVLTDVEIFNQCFENIKKIVSGSIESGKTVVIESIHHGEKIADEINIKSAYTNERLSFGLLKKDTEKEIDVTFSLKPSGNFTYLTIEGRNFSDEFDRSQSENNWINMMQLIKKYIQ